MESKRKCVSKMLEDEQKQMTEWEARHTFTDNLRSVAEGDDDTVDIKEEYDEEAERKRKERRQRNIKSGLVPPPRPAFPKPTNTQPSSHNKPNPSHSEHKRVETRSQSASGQGVSVARKADKQESKESRTREAEKDRELWARLDELEREEEEYLAKEREKRERESAASHELNKEKATATIRTRFSEDSAERKHATTEIREGPSKLKQSAVATGPLRITFKHTPSQDTAAPTRVKMDTADVKGEDQDKALYKSPADIFRHFCKAEVSDESSSEVDSEASKKAASPPSSTAEKGVKWSPNLVEFSDGSKSSQTATSRGTERKSDQPARGGRGRGRGGGKRGNGGRPKEPTKPPMPFSGQVIERFSPMQPTVSAEQGAVKKISKFKASRQQ